MKTKPMSAEEFTDKYGHESIETALRMFTCYHKEKLPKFLITDEGKGKIMLDLLKVAEQNIFLPVVIRSNSWLRQINQVSETMQEICLHEEMWPVQNRFQLVAGLVEISEKNSNGPLFDFLKISVNHWKSTGEACAITVSERVLENTTSDRFKELLKEVQIVDLSAEYKAEELIFI